MNLMRKTKEKRKKKGLSEDFPEEEGTSAQDQGAETEAPDLSAKQAVEANAEDEFALPEKKGKGGKGKQQQQQQQQQQPKPEAADEDLDDSGRVLTKAEKEKLKKEREKQRKKEQVRGSQLFRLRLHHRLHEADILRDRLPRRRLPAPQRPSPRSPPPRRRRPKPLPRPPLPPMRVARRRSSPRIFWLSRSSRRS
jgi:hypothetical protein